MRNNSKLLSEVGRMIELSEINPKRREILKENIKKRLKLNEVFGDDDEDDDVDTITQDDVEGKDDSLKTDKNIFVDKWNYDDDISKKLKLALLVNPDIGIDKQKAEDVGFTEDDFVKKEDLSTSSINPTHDAPEEEDIGARVYKRAYPLYKMDSFEDFDRETSKGKVFIKYRDSDPFYKWLTTKNLNSIGINKSSGKISEDGNATLNFLARVLSEKGLRDGEQALIDLAGKESSKNKSLSILTDFYNVAGTNNLLPLLNMEPTPENIDSIKDGITKAVLNLSGIGGVELSKEDTNWNGTSNIGPWILQVAKNSAIDELRGKNKKARRSWC